MTAAQALSTLQSSALRIFTTGNFRLLAGLSAVSASQTLRRLMAAGLLLRLKRGLWALKSAQNLRVAEAVPHLTHPWPSYVSLHSALSEAGVIAEQPSVTFAVSAGPGFTRKTPLGPLRVVHLPPQWIWGYTQAQAGSSRYPLADPEKALLDLAYLCQVPRSGLRWPPVRAGRARVDARKLRAYAKRMGLLNPRLRVVPLLERLLSGRSQ